MGMVRRLCLDGPPRREQAVRLVQDHRPEGHAMHPLLNAVILTFGLALPPDDAPTVRVETPAPSPDRTAYAQTIASVVERRAALFVRLEQSRSVQEREDVLAEASLLLRRAIVDELAPHWYGTPWAYHGTTQVPGEGSIACGYFVTTLLRDVGLDLPRVRLAQVPSETMIRALVDRPAIRRYSDVPIDGFVESVREWGEGLYIVGLDIHVGFVVHDERGVRFLHSSYVEPSQVVEEPAEDSVILAGSRYRVLGRLTTDAGLLESWLRGRRVGAGG